MNLDALTYAGNPANLADVADERALPLRARLDLRRRRRRATPPRAATRSSTSPPRRTSTARSWRPATSSRPTSSARYLLLEWIRDHGGRLVHVSTDEVYGDIEPGYASREDDALRPSSPYSASKAGGDLQVLAAVRTYGVDAVITRGSNNYGPEPVPREADPAVHDEPARRRAGAGLRRRPPVARLHLRRGSLRGHRDACSSAARAARSTTSAAATRSRTSTTTTRLLELTGRDESHIRYVTDRPGHDRRYALDTSKLQGLGWKPEVTFDEGLRAHGRLVPREPRLVGADQERRRLRRVPAQAVRRRRQVTRRARPRPTRPAGTSTRSPSGSSGRSSRPTRSRCSATSWRRSRSRCSSSSARARRSSPASRSRSRSCPTCSAARCSRASSTACRRAA